LIHLNLHFSQNFSSSLKTKSSKDIPQTSSEIADSSNI
jgi:hypothetical protein